MTDAGFDPWPEASSRDFPLSIPRGPVLLVTHVDSVGGQLEMAEAAAQVTAGGSTALFLSLPETPLTRGSSNIRRELTELRALPRLTSMRRMLRSIGVEQLREPSTQSGHETPSIPSRPQEILELYNWTEWKRCSVFSVVNDFVDRDVLMGESLRRLAACAAKDFDRAFQTVQRVLLREGAVCVIVRNGRFPVPAGALAAADSLGIPSRVLETGATYERLAWYSKSPHSQSEWQAQTRALWEGAPRDSREVVAHDWFRSQSRATANPFHSPCASPPPALLRKRPRAVYFTSSAHEYAMGADRPDTSYFQDETEALAAVVTVCREFDVELVVRAHPTLKSAIGRLSERNDRIANSAATPEVRVISSLDPTDSYALLEESDVCFTFKSSMAVQALYRGVPAFTLGPGYHKGLAPEFDVRNWEELVAHFERGVPTAETWDPLRALPYGYYRATRGVERRFVGS